MLKDIRNNQTKWSVKKRANMCLLMASSWVSAGTMMTKFDPKYVWDQVPISIFSFHLKFQIRRKFRFDIILVIML